MIVRLMSMVLFAGFAMVALADGPAVEFIAHRGASYDAPENTVASFKLAWEQRADGAECDLYLTKDNQIVAIHDKTTKRTAGIEKIVAQCTLEELRALDVGTWKLERFRGEKIPTFAELLATMPEGKKIYIEVKCGPEIVPELLRQLHASRLPPQLTPVICFNADVIAAVKQQSPQHPAYFLHSPEKITAEELISKAKAIHADGVDLKAVKELDQAYAEKIHAAGLRLDVWTVNDVAEARRLIDLGVKGITTDRPAYLREGLQLQSNR
ncbi:MAG TPA: glycerophosphodiester phosphodiesterase [Planctomicrobium sp.]|nr:glycerophosphodiester phosphodiesterase [Planctomicrobium sp.]